MLVRTRTFAAGLQRLRVGLARGMAVALLAAVGIMVAAQPAAAATATLLSNGGVHTCALVSGGQVSCWGQNLSGSVGDGTTTNRRSPVAVVGLAGVTQISAGTSHACALSSAGAVYCWGNNNFGQLGDGTTTDRHSPVAVTGLPGGVTVTQISAGGNHTCALSSAGAVYCWGYNNFGQLGDGTTTDRHSPVAVTGMAGVTRISAGDDHTCAVSAGAVSCWGINSNGQLGDGTTADRHSPVAVTGLAGVTRISAGGAHACALSAGAVSCWGYNGAGQLGDGTTTERHSPVAVVGLAGVTQISAGAYHTCAVSTGTAYCWGDNALGDLGDGTSTQRHSPVAVDTSGVLHGLTVTQVSAGGRSACAVSSAGRAYCWGDNQVGQVGDGSITNRLSPVAVNALPTTSPNPPTGVTAAAGNRQATVSWTAPSYLGSGTLTGYTATANPGGATCTTTGATTCIITGLTNGTAYTFAVVTHTGDGDSTVSAASAAVTPAMPAAPALPDQEPAGDGPLTSAQGSTLAPGSHTTLSGTGFAPNTPITIGIYSTPRVLTTTVTDSTGSFSAEVTIPTGYSGAHTLAAIGLRSDQTTLRTLTLHITVADTSSGGLAITGPALTATIALALALITVGTAAVVTVRRRRPRFTTDTTVVTDWD